MSGRQYEHGDRIPGTQYKCIRKIGEGGHGSVYLVEHTFLEARMVLKTLNAAAGSSKELARRMAAEAKTLAKIRHPNIVEVHDGGMTTDDPPRPFFVMELLRGRTLRELLFEMRSGVGLKSALDIGVSLLDALDVAHTRHGVVHRDLKPENIFLHRTPQEETQPKILDFGIAHVLAKAGRSKNTTGRVFLGTPRYTSPEQLQGKAPTPQTDLYSFGLVLYELLTGRAPFPDIGGIEELGRAHLSRVLPPPSKFMKVPPGIEALVMQCLKKDPKARPKSAGSLAIDLRQVKLVLDHEHALAALDDDNATEPTPMENMMHGYGNASAQVVTAPAGPMARVRVDELTGTTDRDAARFLPLGGHTLENAFPPSATAGLRPLELANPPLDRRAITHTGAPIGHLPLATPTPIIDCAPGYEEREAKASRTPTPRPAAGASSRPRTSTSGAVVAEAEPAKFGRRAELLAAVLALLAFTALFWVIRWEPKRTSAASSEPDVATMATATATAARPPSVETAPIASAILPSEPPAIAEAPPAASPPASVTAARVVVKAAAAAKPASKPATPRMWLGPDPKRPLPASGL